MTYHTVTDIDDQDWIEEVKFKQSDITGIVSLINSSIQNISTINRNYPGTIKKCEGENFFTVNPIPIFDSKRKRYDLGL